MKQVFLYEIERVNKIMETKRKDCLSFNKQLENNPSDPLLKEGLAELTQELKNLGLFRTSFGICTKKLTLIGRKRVFKGKRLLLIHKNTRKALLMNCSPIVR